jgi:Fe2+ or Zn2+ uptake regulation protein
MKALVEKSMMSRSTVYRAVRNLMLSGFVIKVSRGFYVPCDIYQHGLPIWIKKTGRLSARSLFYFMDKRDVKDVKLRVGVVWEDIFEVKPHGYGLKIIHEHGVRYMHDNDVDFVEISYEELQS